MIEILKEGESDKQINVSSILPYLDWTDDKGNWEHSLKFVFRNGRGIADRYLYLLYKSKFIEKFDCSKEKLYWEYDGMGRTIP